MCVLDMPLHKSKKTMEGETVKKYSVLIIGCGSIGALKANEFDMPGGQNVLTHAHAVHDSIMFEIAGLIDTDTVQGVAAADKWKAPYFTSYETFCQLNKSIDVVVVACDTKAHLGIITEVCHSEVSPKLIIIEKPFCENEQDCARALDIGRRKGIQFLVNYSRSFLPFYHTALADFVNESNTMEYCRLLYNRGTMREGSHFINLCNNLFGACVYSSTIPTSRVLHDHSMDDPTYPVVMVYAECSQVIMTPVDGKVAGVFEIDMLSDRGRITLVDNGSLAIHRLISKGNKYGNYPSLLHESAILYTNTGLERALVQVYIHAAKVLEGIAEPLCSGSDALDVHAIYSTLVRELDT